jgi:DNA-binding LacI/PurR family transcriptional regulator
MKKRITVKEVAHAAGVSVATASNALRKVGMTAAGTIERVQSAALKLGYQPDPAVSIVMSSIRQGQMSGHGDVIAYLTAYPRKDEWRAVPTLRRYWDGANERAQELGFRIEEYWLGGAKMSEARHSGILYNRGVRGLILAPHPEAEAHFHLDWSHFATVAISRSIVEPVVHRVLDDHYAIMRVAMQNLLARGYRRIGFAMSRHRVERTARLWLGAYLAYQLELKPADRIPPRLQDIGREKDFDGADLLIWMKRYKPDAIVGLPTPVVPFLEKNGWSCPDDFGYAWIGLQPDDRQHAGVVHNAMEVGRTAVGQIAVMMRNKDFGVPHHPHVTLIEGEWQDGPTVRPSV